jgi:two-component system alkaline phosphatase synthesis response regulator PhoP
MADRRRRVVVVIEDNAGINDVLSEILEELGCRIVPVTDGLEAMEAARLYRPDLITLDLMLPGRDGWAVARELHEAPETGHIPIVIITAHPSEVDPTLGSRVAGVFPKPFNVADVMREIEAILRRRAD